MWRAKFRDSESRPLANLYDAGTWKGTSVAVKSMIFPANMSGKEKRERMAIMETAISSSLSHPNVVQTYTYAIRPVWGDRGCQSQVRVIGGVFRLTVHYLWGKEEPCPRGFKRLSVIVTFVNMP